MSTTPESSADSNPPGLSFAQKREGNDTRWGPGVVMAIIAAIALVAAGVTAAVVLSRKPAPVQPPPPVLGTQMHAAAGYLTVPDGVRLMSSSTTLAGGQTLMAAGDKVELGSSGVSFTLPTGWEIAQQDEGSAVIGNRSSGTALVLWWGTDKVTDVEKLYNALFEKILSSKLSNLQTQPLDAGQLPAKSQKNFDSMAFQQFSGELTDQQGSSQLVGAAEALLNSGKNSQLMTKAGDWVFLVGIAPDADSISKAAPDIQNIESQILGVG